MNSNIQDTQIDDKRIAELLKRKKLVKFIFAVSCVCLSISFIISLTSIANNMVIISYISIILLILGIIFIIVGLIFINKLNQTKINIAINYTPVVLNRVMDQLDEYDHKKYISKDYLRQDLGFPQFDRINCCCDYVKGVLNGIPMEFSEFELQREYMSEDSVGNTSRSYEAVFNGVMIVCRHNLLLSDSFTITQYKRYENALRTDNESFNSLFSINCKNKQDVNTILTPQYIQKLLNLVSEKGNKFAMRFLKDGTLLISIKSLNLFEAGKTVGTAQLIEKMENEMRDFAKTIDMLKIPT